MNVIKKLFGGADSASQKKAQLVLRIDGLPYGAIGSLAFSPDERLLAIACGYVQLWSIEKPPKQITRLKTQAQASSLAFTPDGSTLLIGLHSGVVEIWQTGAWNKDCGLNAHAHLVASAAVDASGKLFATCSYKFDPLGRESMSDADMRVRVWNLAQRAPVAELLGHTAGLDRTSGGVQAVVFEASGNTVISLGCDGKIIKHNWRTAEQTELYGTAAPFKSIVYTADGLVAVGRSVVFPPSISDFPLKKRIQPRKVGVAAGSADGRVIALSSAGGSSGSVPELDIWDTSPNSYSCVLKVPAMKLGPTLGAL
jgi:WD40 repeat protein